MHKNEMMEREREIETLRSELIDRDRQMTVLKATIKQQELELNSIKSSLLGKLNLIHHIKRLRNQWRASRLMKKSGMFGRDYYLEQNPELQETGSDPIDHYLREGVREGRNPNPLFDTVFYLHNNPDVAEDGVNPLVHYIKYGQAEGRKTSMDSGCHTEVVNRENFTEETFNIEKEKEYIDSEISIQPEILLHVDIIQSDGTFIIVEGWALAGKGVERVDLILDGNVDIAARYGTVRADVLEVYPDYASHGNCGFYASLLIILEKGDHHIQVKVTDKEEGVRFQEIPFTVLDDYEKYVAYQKRLYCTSEWMYRTLNHLPFVPRITMVVIVDDPGVFIRETLDNLNSIIYESWDILLACTSKTEKSIIDARKSAFSGPEISTCMIEEITTIIKHSKSDWIGFLNTGCQLFQNVLFEFVMQLNLVPDSEIIYCDENHLNEEDGVFPHYFKPDYSDVLLLTRNFIGDFFLMDKMLFLTSGGYDCFPSGNAFHDLLLRATQVSQRVLHVPIVLYNTLENQPFDIELNRKIIKKNLSRREIAGDLSPNNGIVNVNFRVTGRPRISIIILTAYIKSHINLIPCLQSISIRSTYDNYEVVIVDNSRGKLDRSLVEEIFQNKAEVVFIEYDGAFNYSRMNNIAAEKSSGDYLILLNDDTEVITPKWMENLVGIGQLKNTGVVGVKLYYPDDTLQHGGIIFDHDGVGHHPYHFVEKNRSGYNNYLFLTRNCSAVTFACVLIPKKVYQDLGGLDEILDIECNDTEFCIRANDRGYNVIWTPLAELYHKESASRGHLPVERNLNYFFRKWKEKIVCGDPFFNKNLRLLTAAYPSFNSSSVKTTHFEPREVEESVSYKHRLPLQTSGIKKILIIKVDHIGDMILSIPAMRMIRDIFPEAEITLLCAPWTREIAELIPAVDKVITYAFFDEMSGKLPSDGERKEFRKLMAGQSFDLAVDLRRHDDNRMLFNYLPSFNIGFDSDDFDDSSMSICVERPDCFLETPAFKDKYHLSSQLLYLVRSAFDADVEDLQPYRELPLLPPVENRNKRFEEIKKKYRLIGIHPFSGNYTKQWSFKKFAHLINRIIKELNAFVVVFGAKRESTDMDRIFEHIDQKERTECLVGKIDLSEFIKLIQQVDLFVGNDSGPGHIAGSFDIPSVTIFSGRIIASEWHPFGSANQAVQSIIHCAPCYKAPEVECPFNNACLEGIQVPDVFEAARKALLLKPESAR